MKKTPQNLEVISSGNNKAKQEDAERRRVYRMSVGTEQFRLKENGKVFSVVDMSDSGMALRILDPDDHILLTVGRKLEGSLNLDGKKFDISAQVRHSGADIVGCRFSDLSKHNFSNIHEFVDPKRIGPLLHAIPRADSGTIWYRGPSGTELVFIKTKSDNLIRFSLWMSAILVQWDEGNGLFTAYTRPSPQRSEKQGVFYLDTLVIKRDSEPDSAKLSIAKKLIMSSNLPQELKDFCQQRIGSLKR